MVNFVSVSVVVRKLLGVSELEFNDGVAFTDVYQTDWLVQGAIRKLILLLWGTCRFCSCNLVIKCRIGTVCSLYCRYTESSKENERERERGGSRAT